MSEFFHSLGKRLSPVFRVETQPRVMAEAEYIVRRQSRESELGDFYSTEILHQPEAEVRRLDSVYNRFADEVRRGPVRERRAILFDKKTFSLPSRKVSQ